MQLAANLVCSALDAPSLPVLPALAVRRTNTSTCPSATPRRARSTSRRGWVRCWRATASCPRPTKSSEGAGRGAKCLLSCLLWCRPLMRRQPARQPGPESSLPLSRLALWAGCTLHPNRLPCPAALAPCTGSRRTRRGRCCARSSWTGRTWTSSALRWPRTTTSRCVCGGGQAGLLCGQEGTRRLGPPAAAVFGAWCARDAGSPGAALPRLRVEWLLHTLSSMQTHPCRLRPRRADVD